MVGRSETLKLGLACRRCGKPISIVARRHEDAGVPGGVRVDLEAVTHDQAECWPAVLDEAQALAERQA